MLASHLLPFIHGAGGRAQLAGVIDTEAPDSTSVTHSRAVTALSGAVVRCACRANAIVFLCAASGLPLALSTGWTALLTVVSETEVTISAVVADTEVVATLCGTVAVATLATDAILAFSPAAVGVILTAPFFELIVRARRRTRKALIVESVVFFSTSVTDASYVGAFSSAMILRASRANAILSLPSSVITILAIDYFVFILCTCRRAWYTLGPHPMRLRGTRIAIPCQVFTLCRAVVLRAACTHAVLRFFT